MIFCKFNDEAKLFNYVHTLIIFITVETNGVNGLRRL